jgi:hypothetical protein
MLKNHTKHYFLNLKKVTSNLKFVLIWYMLQHKNGYHLNN